MTRMLQPIDPTRHGTTDYTVGTTLVTVFPRLAGIEGTESARQIRISGATHIAYSTLTDYPLGIKRLIPFQAHLAIDAVGAVALAAVPFVTGQWRRGRSHWLPQVGLAAFELLSLAMSDPTGHGEFHGDISAVQAANTLNPRDAINGPPAVARGAAMAAAG